MEQLTDINEKSAYGDTLKQKAKIISNKLQSIEDGLFQEKIKTIQDEINYARKFTNHIARLCQVMIDDDHRPTGGMLER